MKIQRYLMTVFVLFSIIPIIVIASICAAFNAHEGYQWVKDNVESITIERSEYIKVVLENQLKFFIFFSDLAQVKNSLKSSDYKIHTDLTSIIKEAEDYGNGYIKNIKLINNNGENILTFNNNNEEAFIKIDDKIKDIRQGEFYISSFIKQTDNEKTFIIAMPIYQDNVYLGYVQANIDTALFNVVFDNQSKGKTSSTMLIDNFGETSGGNEYNLNNINDSDFINESKASYDNQIKLYDFIYKNSRRIGCALSIENTPWELLNIVKYSDMIVTYYEASYLILIVILLLLLVIFWSSFSISNKFIVPIKEMTNVMDDIINGNYQTKSVCIKNREFKDIANSFNLLIKKIVNNITEIKFNEERYNLIVEDAQQITFEWDIVNNKIYYSSYWLEKFGYMPLPENPNEKIPNYDRVYADDIPHFKKFFNDILNGKKNNATEVRFYTCDGNYIWCKIIAKSIYDNEGKLLKAIGLVTDINVHKQEIKKLEIKAQKDALTGLYNKVITKSLTENFMAQSGIGSRHAFIMFDIDNFKKINDSLGHMTGDDVLVTVASKIKEVFNSTDVICRAGGDEFIVFVKNLKSKTDLIKKLVRLCEVIREIYADNNIGRVSVSIGISIYPYDGKTFDALYKKADIALYQAKSQGKDRYVFYSEFGRQ